MSARDLAPAARNELKTLSKDNAERVARHLAMAANEIDDNPALAHEHAQAAVRHAGRVAVARETLAITAYATEDFSLALRELRTVRRLTGSNEHVAMIVDSERGVGRPEKALEEGNAADRDELETAQRVQLAIAMSGARLDLGQTELALAELDIAELDPDVAFSWSPGLFAARAAVLEDLGLTLEAEEWARRADVAAEAIAQEMARDDELIVEEITEVEPEDDAADAESRDGLDADAPEVTGLDASTDEAEPAEETPHADDQSAAPVEARLTGEAGAAERTSADDEESGALDDGVEPGDGLGADAPETVEQDAPAEAPEVVERDAAADASEVAGEDALAKEAEAAGETPHADGRSAVPAEARQSGNAGGVESTSADDEESGALDDGAESRDGLDADAPEDAGQDVSADAREAAGQDAPAEDAGGAERARDEDADEAVAAGDGPDIPVEDEVAQILVEAGIDEPDDGSAAPAPAAAQQEDAPAGEAEAARAEDAEQKGDRPDGALF